MLNPFVLASVTWQRSNALATGDEVTQIKDPALLRILLNRGLDLTLRNDRGQTLGEVFRENGNELLKHVMES